MVAAAAVNARSAPKTAPAGVVEAPRAVLDDCDAAPIFVSAFPDRAEFRKHVADIAWETEVWIASDPDHLIHFNGEKFLGPWEAKG